MFSNVGKYDTNSGNITTTIADHYTQFALSKDKHCSKLWKKKITKACSKHKENFETDPKYKNCNKILEIENGNIGVSFDIFFKTFNNILDKHALSKKISVQMKNVSLKPWTSKG